MTAFFGSRRSTGCTSRWWWPGRWCGGGLFAPRGRVKATFKRRPVGLVV